MIIIDGRHGLDLFKLGIIFFFQSIGKNIDRILLFIDNVEKSAVFREFNMPGSRLELAVDNVSLAQVPVFLIQFIYVDMVQSEIGCAKETVIPGHFDTLDMRPEIPVRNTAQPFMEDLVGNLPYRTILI